jgi:hypothetical protein
MLPPLLLLLQLLRSHTLYSCILPPLLLLLLSQLLSLCMLPLQLLLLILPHYLIACMLSPLLPPLLQQSSTPCILPALILLLLLFSSSAFKNQGVDCSNWTAPVYNDLMSQGDGTGEGLVRAYFSRVGWPTFLPTKEDIFTRKVHELKQEQLKKLIQKRKVPPREAVDKVGVGVPAIVLYYKTTVYCTIYSIMVQRMSSFVGTTQ